MRKLFAGWTVAVLTILGAPAPVQAAADDTSVVARALRMQARFGPHPEVGTASVGGSVLERTMVAAGGDTSCSGATTVVWCWGAGQPDPAKVDLPSGMPMGVASGRAHTCVLLWDRVDEDGADLFCWGDNAEGQIGDGTTAARTTPVPVAEKIVQVATGDDHTCAVRFDQTVICWGSNDAGQLGLGSTGGSELTPQAVPDVSDVVSLSAGGDTTCAADENGAPWCWGSDASGQIGDGGGTPAAVPDPTRTTTTEDFRMLAVGRAHTCGVDEDDGVWCWGSDSHGQLGDGGANTGRTEPVKVPGTSDVTVSLAAGADSTCVVNGDGQAMCWGDNAAGQLGTGDKIDQSLPADVDQDAVPSSPFIAELLGTERGMFHQVAIADRHACAVEVQGNLYCWGDNAGGQLGDGTTGTRLVPGPTTLVPTAPTGVAVRAGNQRLAVSWRAAANLGAGALETYAALALGESQDGQCDTRKLACAVTGLTNGDRYLVFVATQTDGGLAVAAGVTAIPAGPQSPAPARGGGQLPITGGGVSLLIVLGGGLIAGGLLLLRRRGA